MMERERPSASYVVDMLPPAARPRTAADAIPVRHLHSSLNKVKQPVNVVRWTPDGRRLLTGSTSGEFTLWNGMAFNFETIMQAHDSGVRAMEYSHSEEFIVSADHNGIIKYHQQNLNSVKIIDAIDKSCIRDLSFSPNDAKFVTARDDAKLKIYDFAAGIEESVLLGHNWDAKTVDWHPTKGLIVSGSKDHQVKLWDPRNSRCLTTLHGHKNTVAKASFEPSRGQLLATCARDLTTRVFDLRMMRDICILRGHEKDITTLVWHPIHASLLSTGAADGSIFHYLLDEPNTPAGSTESIPPYDSIDPSNAPAQTIYPAHRIQHAHDFSVWSLAWHPLGHILASGSNDRLTRFWSRARPGETDCFKDRYHLGEAAAEARGTWDRRSGRRMMREEEEQEAEDEADGLVDQKLPVTQSALPGIPGLTLPGLGASNGANNAGVQKNVLGMGNLSRPPNLPPIIATIDPNQFAAMVASGTLPLPPPPVAGSGQALPPPPPLPANFDFSKFPPGVFPPAFQLPQGFPPPPAGSAGVLPGIATDNAGSRRRAPLPSQQESLMEEQRRGKYRSVR